MSHKVKCQFRVYDENSSGLISQFDEMINRLYSVETSAAISSVMVGDKNTVGKEYTLATHSEETQNQIYHLLEHQCPAPLEVLLHLSYWSVEAVEH